MRRRNKHPAHENHERWLVSYADFITLLFAFFVVMFATSHADKQKARQVSASVRDAFEQGMMPQAISDFMGRRRPNAGKEPLPRVGQGDGPIPPEIDPALIAMSGLALSLQKLNASLSAEINAGKVQVSMEPRGLVISLKEAAFFPPAGDSINEDAYPIIERIAEAARKLPNKILLEGHTDSTPIHNARFASNWDLSSARAIAMLKIFEERFGLPAKRMSVAGYSDTAPVADNDTPESRARNRRVDVVILNEFGLKSQPGVDKKPAAL